MNNHLYNTDIRMEKCIAYLQISNEIFPKMKVALFTITLIIRNVLPKAADT